ncbi:MAG TPA: GAF domain-containing protein, partial [Rhodanobacteraceae bacterium]|nr:GAF domain-containing protein [Rhodanobacteraceae bacterium]
MAGNVHHLAAPASPSPVAAASLRASETLWAAENLDQVVAAARAMLTDLVPGATVQRCAGDGDGLGAASDHRLQVPLSDREMLVLAGNGSPEAADVLHAAAALLRARIGALGRQTAMAESVEQLGRAEKLQRALYAIADQASTAGADITAMFGALHQIVGTLMYAQNFFVTLHDASRDSVRFPYYADVADPTIPDPHHDMSMADIERGPTWYVIRDGKPLMGSLEALKHQVSGPFHSSGTDCVDWLGVPLLRGGEVVGCVVVQSYDDAHHYEEQDKALLIYVAQHIQTALERRLAHAELEHRVGERTEALRNANRVLQQQVLERQRGERLQAALFRIAELATTTDSIDNFYAAVHRVVGGLLYARNFYIALLSEDGADLTFPYSVDERDQKRLPRKLANGLTEYVLRHS